MEKALVYKADDRSILLPYYKRFCVEPTLPFIPAKLHPNVITHFGHVVNLIAVAMLVAMRPRHGWVFIASMLLLQVYNWADNADGAHARRTRQSSAFGEFLDHGLDVLNTTYIGLMTVLAIDSSHEWAILLTIIIPGAASLTYWEQAETGIFRLGLLNQIESVMVLSFIMVIDAVLGVDVLHRVAIGPVTAWHFLHVWPLITILFGMARGVQRVHAAKRPVSPALAFLGLHAMIFAAGWLHLLSTLAAVSIAVAVNVFWGARMLSRRLAGESPRVEPALLVGLVAMAGYMAFRSAGHALTNEQGAALAALVCGSYAVCSVNAARAGIASLERPADEASRQAA
jgi:phosphatidylglycerophosphate synthase